MGLETAPQSPLGRIDVSALAPQADPNLVQPRNVAVMADLFRQGLITADDIHNRAQERQLVQARSALELDPAIQAAKRESLLNAAAAQKLQLEQTQLEIDKARLTAAMPPVVKQMNDDLMKFGLSVIPDGKSPWTQDDTATVLGRWRDVENWKTETASNKARLESLTPVDQVDPESGVTYRAVVAGKSQRQADPEKIAAAENFSALYPSPREWIVAGKPSSPDIFGETSPGEVSTVETAPPATPAVTPTASPAATATPAPAVTPRTGFPQVKPGLGIPVKLPAGSERAATEAQTKAANFVARSLTANEVLNNLASAGYNPSTVGNWAQEFLVGPLAVFKTAGQREYESAKQSWVQGLLRLESGAAISTKEQSWYEKTFFPVVGDPPAVQRQKAKMRADVETIADNVAKSGRLDAAKLLGVRERAETVSDLSADMGAAKAAKPVTISGIGEVNLIPDQNGRIRIVRAGAATGNASTYVPPDKLSGKKPVEVKIKDAPMRPLSELPPE